MSLAPKRNPKESAEPPPSEDWLAQVIKPAWWTMRRAFEQLEDWAQNRWFQTFRLLATLAFLWWAYHQVHRESLLGADGFMDLTRMGRDSLLTVGIATMVAILWADRITGGLGGLFLALIDTADHRAIEMHPMDRLNQFIRDGKTPRARRLCRQMIRKKAADPQMLAAILERLNERERRIQLGPPPRRIRGSK